MYLPAAGVKWYIAAMKPLSPFKQSIGMNGPACLKILLSHYGKDLSETELAAASGTTADSGTTHDGLIAAIRSIGAMATAKAPATLDDLRIHVENDIPVIVDWQLNGARHYSVVYEVGKAKVYLMDPEAAAGIRILPIEDFEKNWGERWMLTVAGL